MRMRGAIKKGAPQVLRGVSEETGAAQATSVSGGRSWDALPKIQKKKQRDLKLRAVEGKEWRCKLWHIQNMDLLKEESKSGTVAVPTDIWLLRVDETCGSRPLTTSPQETGTKPHPGDAFKFQVQRKILRESKKETNDFLRGTESGCSWTSLKLRKSKDNVTKFTDFGE